MVVVLAGMAALAYGLSDYVGGTASRRTTPWAVALASQLGGALLALVLLTVDHGSPRTADLAWALLAGVGNGVGTAFLYRGLGSGRMGVVAPVSAVGAALVPVAAGLVAGERPGLLPWLGVLVALPAIWLVASEPTSGPGVGPGSTSAGLRDGVLAGLGFGTLFAALAQLDDAAGPLPFVLNQLVGAVVIVTVALVLGVRWAPREPAALLGAVSGGLGVTATLLFTAASRVGYLTVAAVITSLYPAITVLLAATLLHERVHPRQGVGLALCAAAVVLTALG